ncbi:MAG: DUF4920 domain-containing protein [Thermoanaerobaculia bacterium]
MRLPMQPTVLLSILALSVAPLAAATCDSVSYGAGVKLAETTPVGTLLDHPEKFAGQDVRVEGEVHAVCAMAGCWMEIAAAEGGRTVKVQVEDGAMVFPLSAKGKKASAQGKLEDVSMSRTQYVHFMKHAAEDAGTSFDETSVEGDGPFHVYQIAGSGAEICI